MVFSGKPSKACLICRQRRIKCDLARPSCTQCIRLGRQCKGYRNALDLNFRDESQGVVEKARRRSAKRQTTGIESQSGPAISLENPAPSQRLGVLSPPVPPPSLPSADQAVSFFFRTHLNESRSLVYGFLPQLYDADQGSALSHIIKAIGLEGLSNYRRAPTLMSSAYVQYNDAVHLLGLALRDPIQAKTDQVLLVVHLMGVYETDVGREQQSMIAWKNHIAGAVALLKIRGKEQLQTELGRRLFFAIRKQITIYSVQTRQPLPDEVDQFTDILRIHARNKGDTDNESLLTMAQLITSICNLLAKAVTEPLALCPEEWLAQALSIDHDLTNCHATLPTAVLYSTVLSSDPDPTIHAGYYYIWRIRGDASYFLPFWIIEILLHGLIIQQLERLHTSRDDDSDEIVSYCTLQRQRSATTITSCISHICASVHYHLSFGQSLTSSGKSSSGSSPLPCATSMDAILKPLFVAGDSVFCPLATRSWIVKQLRFMGSELGLRQALLLADDIVQKDDPQDWLLQRRR